MNRLLHDIEPILLLCFLVVGLEEAPEPITVTIEEPEVAEPEQERIAEPAMAAESKSEDLVMVF